MPRETTRFRLKAIRRDPGLAGSWRKMLAPTRVRSADRQTGQGCAAWSRMRLRTSGRCLAWTEQVAGRCARTTVHDAALTTDRPLRGLGDRHGDREWPGQTSGGRARAHHPWGLPRLGRGVDGHPAVVIRLTGAHHDLGRRLPLIRVLASSVQDLRGSVAFPIFATGPGFVRKPVGGQCNAPDRKSGDPSAAAFNPGKHVTVVSPCVRRRIRPARPGKRSSCRR